MCLEQVLETRDMLNMFNECLGWSPLRSPDTFSISNKFNPKPCFERIFPFVGESITHSVQATIVVRPFGQEALTKKTQFSAKFVACKKREHLKTFQMFPFPPEI